ncbi:hypothetical protein [Panacagrimonas sp.]|uniref:hypothetical protein n=1 Tax=Panacagrimonas sp. TaxID=2480088 RepID=UPI003B52CD90
MGRRRRFTAQEDVDRYLDEKVSVGGDTPYRSGVSINDFNSFGICNRVYDPRSDQTQLFLSNGEYGYNDLILFDQRIISSEEQRPVLEMLETRTLALELGIAHPREGKVLIPFRTDHYLKLRRKPGGPILEVAVEVKEQKALKGKKGRRIREKKELLEIFFEVHGAQYLLVFKETLDQQVLKNLRFLRYGSAGNLTWKATRSIRSFAECFCQTWSRRPRSTLDELAARAANELGFSRDTSLQLFQVAARRKFIPVDLRHRVLPILPLVKTDHPDLGVTFPW